MLFADPVLDPDHWVVYLMYRADRGWRIGLTESVRQNDRGRPELGPEVRLSQEHGDALWILTVTDSRAEASYWEAYFSTEFGIPTVRFHGVGRDLAMDDALLQRLFAEIDTDVRAKELMDSCDLHVEFPHLRHEGGGRRQTLNLSMFGGERRAGGIAHHRVQWCSTRPEVAERLPRRGHRGAQRQVGEQAVRDECGRTTSRPPTSRIAWPTSGAC